MRRLVLTIAAVEALIAAGAWASASSVEVLRTTDLIVSLALLGFVLLGWTRPAFALAVLELALAALALIAAVPQPIQYVDLLASIVLLAALGVQWGAARFQRA